MERSKIIRWISITINILVLLNYIFVPFFVCRLPELNIRTAWSLPVMLGNGLIAAGNHTGMTGLLVETGLKLPVTGLSGLEGFLFCSVIFMILSLSIPCLNVIALIKSMSRDSRGNLMQLTFIHSVIILLLCAAALVLKKIWNEQWMLILTDMIRLDASLGPLKGSLENAFSWTAGFYLALCMALAGLGLYLYDRYKTSLIESTSYQHDSENSDEEAMKAFKRFGAKAPSVISLKKDDRSMIHIDRLPCVIGRNKNEVDYFIHDESLSRRHCEIDIIGGEAHVKDLNSLYGIKINQVRIEPETRVPVHSGDVLTLGKLSFVLEIDWEGVKTKMPEKMKHKPAVDADRVFSEVSSGTVSDWAPSVMLCPTGKSPLNGNCYISSTPFMIGRSRKRCHFVIDDLSISREHAKMIFHNDHYYLEDMGSTNGSFINGNRLLPGERKRLYPNDILRFGDVELCYRDERQ